MKCGECLSKHQRIVALDSSGKCPSCGTTYAAPDVFNIPITPKKKQVPKPVTVTQAEFDKRAKEIAEKSFILGVDWLSKVLAKQEVLTYQQADLFHAQAERIFRKVTG